MSVSVIGRHPASGSVSYWDRKQNTESHFSYIPSSLSAVPFPRLYGSLHCPGIPNYQSANALCSDYIIRLFSRCCLLFQSRRYRIPSAEFQSAHAVQEHIPHSREQSTAAEMQRPLFPVHQPAGNFSVRAASGVF